MKRILTALPKALKISLSLLALSVLLTALFPSAHRLTAVFAMLFSSLGDMALMDFRRFFSRRTPSPLITGGLLFALSHLLYAAAYAVLLKGSGLMPSSAGIIAAALIGLGAFVSLIGLSVRNRRFRRIKAPLLLLYDIFISLDCASVFGCAFALAGQGGAWRLIGCVGIVSFFASDFFIGLDIMAGERRMRKYVWPFYALGQALLLIAA